MPISFTKIDLPFGWLGNMASFPVEYDGKLWLTTEHLFQALRFDDVAIKEEIRGIANPFAAKLRAKKIANEQPEKVVVVPRSKHDLANMRMVLRLKLKQHPELKQQLLDTGDEVIIEDSSKRHGESARFWGAGRKNGRWVGENMLGKLWMKLREELNRRKKKAKKVAAQDAVPSSNGDVVTTILKVKSWADEMGGMKRLKALVEALSE